jgi:hypothetical protein
MPEFEQPNAKPHRSIMIHFADDEAVDAFAKATALGVTKLTRYMWYPKKEHDKTIDIAWQEEDAK